ncbi:acetyltransferase (GNAT) family domain-containing protein [Ditylenchus destructor]|uniref:Glucosamine 6-phosphate N-acetyltransferase n=1 Tax=Ditylenchus destructor TaxID=166010 RepID=A0AAD4NIB7_9BILA|nr:acetyltransferase (GNAT) family domain-containing protein [Ditylenchus destructor]
MSFGTSMAGVGFLAKFSSMFTCASERPKPNPVPVKMTVSNFSQLLEVAGCEERPPPGYTLRLLELVDYDKGFVELLAQLTAVGTISRETFEERFRSMAKTGLYYVIVIEDLGVKKIVGTATLVLEYKFIHECGRRGRIEDVVVDESARGKSFGKLLNRCLVKLAKYFGVYKLSLECKDNLIKFYEQFGLQLDVGNNFLVQRFDK